MSQVDASIPFVSRRREPARPELRSIGQEGDALLSAVAKALSTLRQLFRHEELLDAPALHTVRETGKAVEERLARKELRVVVVGEEQCGKSTLLDAIIGDRLLGQARGESRACTFIRQRRVPNYVAKFSSGTTEEFSATVPDSTSELDQNACSLAESLGTAKRQCAAARSELRRAIEAQEEADRAAASAEEELARARRSAEDAVREASSLAEQASRVETDLVTSERSVPESLRRVPPRWAFWLWLLRGVFWIAKRAAWARYRTVSLEHREIHQRAHAAQSGALERNFELTSVETRRQSLVDAAEGARDAAREAERALREAERKRDEIQGELERLGAERELREEVRRRRFFSSLEELCRERPERTSVTQVEVEYPTRLLPPDVAVIDMPGAFSDRAPEWRAIRDQVDGCIFVSEIDRAVSESAKRFLRQLREVVPHLLLVLTKVDEAFADAVSRGEDAWQHVEQARRIGVRRFARELGRDPETVLSVAVAAEAALTLPGSELARRFDAEMEKLFELLRRERAMILGANAASAIRRCLGGIADAERVAENSYRARITELERERTPVPDAFVESRLSALEPEIRAAAQRAVADAAASLGSAISSSKQKARQRLEGSRSEKELIGAFERLAETLSEESARAHREAYRTLDAHVEGAVESLAAGLFEELRRQYRLLHDIENAPDTSLRLELADTKRPSFGALVTRARKIRAQFDRERYALGLGGALTFAGAGLFVSPWLSLGGAMLGALGGLIRRKRPLCERFVCLMDAGLDEQERSYLEEIHATQTAVASNIRAGCHRALEDAILRFGRYIAEPIEAEQRAIDEQRDRLAELERIRSELEAHDRELVQLLKAAAGASAGLCR